MNKGSLGKNWEITYSKGRVREKGVQRKKK